MFYRRFGRNINYLIISVFHKKDVPRFHTQKMEHAYFRKNGRCAIFNFSWGIKKLGHPFFYLYLKLYNAYRHSSNLINRTK